MKVLVTGCAGFLGNILCRKLLEKGYSVSGCDNFYRGNPSSLIPLLNSPNFTFHKVDFTNPASCRIVEASDAVIHLAAIVGSPSVYENKALSQLINVESTRNLTNFNKNKPFIFSSTECVYFNRGEITESSTVNPQSLYGQQKLESENFVLEGENGVVFRFAAGCGLSSSMRLNLLPHTLAYEAVHNKTMVIYQADVIRNFINVEDMADCLIFALENKLKDRVYNACGFSATKRDIAEYISTITLASVFYGDYAQDVDSRDGRLNSNRLISDGFKYRYDMKNTLDSIVRAMKLVNIKEFNG